MNSPLSVYIHWPFCKSKCPYCDFNSHVRDGVDHQRWRAALLKELAYYRQMLPERNVVSVFFGGGTPSLMEPDTATALIEAVRGGWAHDDDLEVTLEANPTSVEAEKLEAFRKAGISRASLGVQSLKAESLAFLGRQHSAGEAMAAVKLAGEIFPRMSFDLIYALPGQSAEAWEEELTQALAFTKGHMSLYQLTIEENTAFHHAFHQGKIVMPEDDAAAILYEQTNAIMEAQGMPAYEISNYAAPTQESRHNLAYWRGDEYIGIGPGAHGRYRDADGNWIATQTIKSPERWLELTEAGTSQIEQSLLTPRERAEEVIMMGLRLVGGIDCPAWERRLGLDLDGAVSVAGKQMLVEHGLLVPAEQSLRATSKGMLLLSSITKTLLR